MNMINKNIKMYVIMCLVLISALIPLSHQQHDELPNIVLILTDDQDVELQGLIPMTATQNLVGLEGVTFLNAFTSSPICCPSRASILSGQYSHNHATINNSRSGGCYGDFWQEHVEPRALPVQLNTNGYETFFAGKYLNEYFTEKVPPGWDHFYGLHGNSRYYDYILTENGVKRNYSNDYLTDVLKDKVLKFLNDERDISKPFFAMIAPPAPHRPSTPADRHNSTFEFVKALRTPNFNMVPDSLNKHWLVSSMGKPLSSTLIKTLDLYYRKRWQSLLAVDELISEVINLLEKKNKLKNTYIIFTSDNGYHIGQFTLPYDKRMPYETDIRIPLMIRGPNVPRKSVTDYPVVLIDLYPTILEWAGIENFNHSFQDGISFNSYLTESNDENISVMGNKNFHRQILIEYWGEGSSETYNPHCPWSKSDNLYGCSTEIDCHCQDSRNNTYSCVRHFAYNTNKIYCQFKDNESFVEAYDLHVDQYQIKNLGYELLPSERAMYDLALKNLTKCVADSCRNAQF